MERDHVITTLHGAKLAAVTPLAYDILSWAGMDFLVFAAPLAIAGMDHLSEYFVSVAQGLLAVEV
jgi:hypothetical protein